MSIQGSSVYLIIVVCVYVFISVFVRPTYHLYVCMCVCQCSSVCLIVQCVHGNLFGVLPSVLRSLVLVVSVLLVDGLVQGGSGHFRGPVGY